MVESIAPEDIRFSPAARDEDKASFLGFIRRASSSDLVRLGLTTDEIDDLRSERGQLSDEEAQRTDGVAEDDARTGDGDSERPIWLVVAYIRADSDGDGISELLRVVYAHVGGAADRGGGRIIERARRAGRQAGPDRIPSSASARRMGRSWNAWGGSRRPRRRG